MLSSREKFTLVIVSCLAYFMMDVPVQMTGILPSYAGIKNFLPSTLGLFFGLYGVTGCVLGCILSAIILGSQSNAVIIDSNRTRNVPCVAHVDEIIKAVLQIMAGLRPLYCDTFRTERTYGNALSYFGWSGVFSHRITNRPADQYPFLVIALH